VRPPNYRDVAMSNSVKDIRASIDEKQQHPFITAIAEIIGSTANRIFSGLYTHKDKRLPNAFKENLTALFTVAFDKSQSSITTLPQQLSNHFHIFNKAHQNELTNAWVQQLMLYVEDILFEDAEIAVWLTQQLGPTLTEKLESDFEVSETSEIGKVVFTDYSALRISLIRGFTNALILNRDMFKHTEKKQQLQDMVAGTTLANLQEYKSVREQELQKIVINGLTKYRQAIVDAKLSLEEKLPEYQAQQSTSVTAEYKGKYTSAVINRFENIITQIDQKMNNPSTQEDDSTPKPVLTLDDLNQVHNNFCSVLEDKILNKQLELTDTNFRSFINGLFSSIYRSIKSVFTSAIIEFAQLRIPRLLKSDAEKPVAKVADITNSVFKDFTLKYQNESSTVTPVPTPTNGAA